MNKKKVVILAVIIMAGIVIINIINKITERTDEEYISIFLDNREDFGYVAEMMQQWPDSSSIHFENGITSTNMEITEEISNNKDLYEHLKNLYDLKEVQYIIVEKDEIVFYFAKFPKDHHGGVAYGKNLNMDSMPNHKIDECWVLRMIPNV